MQEIEKAIAQHFWPVIIDNTYEKENIIQRINELIKNDFEKLVFILYRIDVQEDKIKSALANAHGADAAGIIYNLISERETEKLFSKKQYRQNEPENKEDAW